MIPEETKADLSNLTHIFLVMDYFEADLKQALIANPDNFKADHIITLMYNMLCAINFMHSAGVIHRDIKPANILIDNYCSVKICDFGISRTYADSESTKYLALNRRNTNDVEER